MWSMEFLFHLCPGGSRTPEMEKAWQQGSPNSPLDFEASTSASPNSPLDFEASSSASGAPLRKCVSMYEQTNKSINHSLKKCMTSTDMAVVDEFDPDTRDALAHIIARPDVSLLKRRESERNIPASPLTQLFSSNQRKSGEHPRMLVNVTMRGSSGPLKVIVDSDSGPVKVIEKALAVYAREGRLPVLICATDAYELYCGHDLSKAVLAKQRVGDLGQRNFLMCPRKNASTTKKQGPGIGELVDKSQKCNTFSSFMSYYVHITL